MASRFATSGTLAVAGDTILTIVAPGATVRPRMYYLLMSASAAVADAIIDFSVRHISDDSTTAGTPVTPRPLDAGDRAAVATSDQTCTSEPTYTGINMLDLGLNQRSVFQWYAQEGGEIIGNLATNDGIGVIIDAFSSGTPQMMCTMHFAE